jgi:hypothetical protein
MRNLLGEQISSAGYALHDLVAAELNTSIASVLHDARRALMELNAIMYSVNFKSYK